MQDIRPWESPESMLYMYHRNSQTYRNACYLRVDYKKCQVLVHYRRVLLCHIEIWRSPSMSWNQRFSNHFVPSPCYTLLCYASANELSGCCLAACAQHSIKACIAQTQHQYKTLTKTIQLQNFKKRKTKQTEQNKTPTNK